MSQKNCPCGTQIPFEECCNLYLSDQKVAESPEVLMRSRYTAFCKNDIGYLKKTWHPETLPDDLSPDEPHNWIGLKIINASAEETEGEVEFMARLIHEGKVETLHERSLFLPENGQWLYHSGEFLNEGAVPEKVKPAAPCPCGSGKKFKNCHGGK